MPDIVSVSQLSTFSDQVIFKLKNARLNLGLWNLKMTRYVHIATKTKAATSFEEQSCKIR